MLSPGQRHNQRIKMKKQLEAKQAILIADSDSLHIAVISLNRDVARLKALANNKERAEMKRDELLPRYLPSVDAYLDAGEIFTNPIFAWCIIWLFDVGQFDKALDWADVAIEQGQPTPDGIKSTFPAFVADTVLAWATAEQNDGNDIEPYFSRTFKNVTENWTVHEKIIAKWYKFAGLNLLRNKENEVKASDISDPALLTQSRELLETACKFDINVGAKTHISRIDARLRALTAE